MTSAEKPSPIVIKTLSPRFQRLLMALLERPRTIRELVDVIPSNNPSEYVRQLRHDYGLTIFCEHIRFTTVDGTPSWYGVYHLSSSDRKKLCGALEV